MFDPSLQMFDPAALVQGMRREMTEMGFQELRTPEEVDAALNEARGWAVVFVNSVCGCAGGIARPAMRHVLQHGQIRPDYLYTVFAGQDKEATQRARTYFTGYPPSSPSVALLKDGRIVAMMERHQIEGRDAAAVAADLQALLAKHLGAAAGPEG